MTTNDEKKNQESAVATEGSEVSLDEAIAFFEKSKSFSNLQQPMEPYLNLGQAYLLKGWVKKALIELQAGLKLEPGHKAARQLLESIELSLN